MMSQVVGLQRRAVGQIGDRDLGGEIIAARTNLVCDLAPCLIHGEARDDNQHT